MDFIFYRILNLVTEKSRNQNIVKLILNSPNFEMDTTQMYSVYLFIVLAKLLLLLVVVVVYEVLSKAV